MTKLKKESSQQTIFEWLKKAEELSSLSANPPGSLDITKEFKSALSDDLSQAKNEEGRELSRYQVAARISELLGEDITKTTLDNWTALSHPHVPPAPWMPALIIATGGQRRAFTVLSRHAGLFALPGPEALRAEIQRLDEEIKRKKIEKFKRMIFLKEIEK